jgi:uncharacterized protein YegP (UPF0339 family)
MTAKVEKVRIYKDAAGEWRWTAKAANGEPIADSGEGYESRDYCRGVVVGMFPGAEIVVDGDPSEG